MVCYSHWVYCNKECYGAPFFLIKKPSVETPGLYQLLTKNNSLYILLNHFGDLLQGLSVIRIRGITSLCYLLNKLVRVRLYR